MAKKSPAQNIHATYPALTYFLTRDTMFDGTLSSRVDVWLVRPERTTSPAGTVWTCPDVMVRTLTGASPAHCPPWTVAWALIQCRTYPDDDLQCIRVGGEETIGEVIGLAEA